MQSMLFRELHLACEPLRPFRNAVLLLICRIIPSVELQHTWRFEQRHLLVDDAQLIVAAQDCSGNYLIESGVMR